MARYKIDRLISKNDSGWFVADAYDTFARENVTVVAASWDDTALCPDIEKGCIIEAARTWQAKHPKYGDQIKCSGVSIFKPAAVPAASYLKQANGIGDALAERIVQRMGDDLNVIASCDKVQLMDKADLTARQAGSVYALLHSMEPHHIIGRAFPSLSEKQQRMCADKLRDPYSRFALRLPPAMRPLTDNDVEVYLRAVKYLKTHPYYLYWLPEVGFPTVDKVARVDCGYADLTSDSRLDACVLCAVEAMLDGTYSAVAKGKDGTEHSGAANEYVVNYGNSMYIDLADDPMTYARWMTNTKGVSTGLCALRNIANSFAGGLIDETTLRVCLKRLIDAGELVTESVMIDGVAYHSRFYSTQMRRRQDRLVKNLAECVCNTQSKAMNDAQLTHFVETFRDEEGHPLSEEQKAAVIASLSSKVSIVTGGPGTGKTFTVNAIVQAFLEVKRGKHVYVLGPTGRSVQRAREMVDPALVEAFATIAGFNVSTSKSDNPNRNRDFILNDDTLFVLDEVSMLDMTTAAAFCAARGFKNVSVVFVGDFDQLPSIGPAEFFADIIDCGCFPVSKLTENHRAANGSSIPAHVQAILAGDNTRAWIPMFDFETCWTSDYEQLIAQATRRYLKLVQVEHMDVRDVGLLTMTNAVRKELNLRIRAELNPRCKYTAPEKFDRVLKHAKYIDEPGVPIPYGHKAKDTDPQVGDRVMCQRNDYDEKRFRTTDGSLDTRRKNGEHGFNAIVNGECGTVVRFYGDDDNWEDGEVLIQFDDGSYAFLPIIQFHHDYTLAWAVTVHKSQGCEYSYVLFCVNEVRSIAFANRNLVYTAVTRAKDHVTVIGLYDIAQTAIACPRVRRKSTFARELAEAISGLNVVGN